MSWLKTNFEREARAAEKRNAQANKYLEKLADRLEGEIIQYKKEHPVKVGPIDFKTMYFGIGNNLTKPETLPAYKRIHEICKKNDVKVEIVAFAGINMMFGPQIVGRGGTEFSLNIDVHSHYNESPDAATFCPSIKKPAPPSRP